MTEKLHKIADSEIFRLAMHAITLCFVPWAIWVTVGQFGSESFQRQGGRFSEADGLKMREEILTRLYDMRNDLDSRIDKLPPPEWQLQIRKTANDIEELEDLVHEFERNFTKDFVRWSELPKELRP